VLTCSLDSHEIKSVLVIETHAAGMGPSMALLSWVGLWAVRVCLTCHRGANVHAPARFVAKSTNRCTCLCRAACLLHRHGGGVALHDEEATDYRRRDIDHAMQIAEVPHTSLISTTHSTSRIGV
jgi:hypothetical protein